MKVLNFVKRIPDPIWGEIPITVIEDKIIRTKIFNRLRYIKQMGFSYLSFPGANHSRYEHSLGTMHVASMLATTAIISEQKINISDYLQAIRLAALLHDIGHPPFSHAVEETFFKYPKLLSDCFASKKGKKKNYLIKLLEKSKKYSHEVFTEYAINTDNDLNEVLRNIAPYRVDQIASLAIGRATDKGFSFFNPLMDYDIDADKIDYILRDGYYTGLSYKFDISELRKKFFINKENNQLCILPEAISIINSLLLARYRLVNKIQHDKANRIANQMMVDEVMSVFKKIQKEERLEKIKELHMKMTTEEFETFLKENGGTLIDKILYGKLYKQIDVSLSFKQMHPAIKIFTNHIYYHPKYITILQNKLRECFKNNNTLLVDICEAKPPKANILVSRQDDKLADILSENPTLIGILKDSFIDFNIHLYDKRENALDLIQNSSDLLKENQEDEYFIGNGLNEIQKVIEIKVIEVSRYIRNEMLNTQNGNKSKIIGIDLILLVLNMIDKYCQSNFETLGKRKFWIYKTRNLYSFVKNIITLVSSFYQKDYDFNDDDKCYPLFVRDLTRLDCMGLIEHLDKNIPYPYKKNSTEVKWINRIQQRISGWGKGYVDSEFDNSKYKDIDSKIIDVLDNSKELLINYLKKKDDREELKGNVEQRQKLSKEVRLIQNEIEKRDGCIITL